MKLRSLLYMTSAALMFGVASLAPVQAQTPPDTLIMAHAIDGVTSFDPAEVFEFVGGEISNNVYLRLVVRDENNFAEVTGGAAESWEVSEDGLVFTFKIRDGLTFASGSKVTAEDAAFSLQRVVKLDKSPAFILTQFGWTAENVDQNVRALDDQTLELKIAEPYAPTLVLNALSAGVGSIVEKEVVLSHEKDGDLGHDWLRSNSAGAGAFVLRDWQPNEAIVLEANASFYLGAPGLQRVIYRHVPEATAQRLMLERGDVDMARELGAEQLDALESNPDIKIQIDQKATVLYLGLNETMPELADPKVQEAIRLLVDYDGIANTLLKHQYKVHQSVLASGGYAALEERPHAYNVEKAKQLLSESAYPNGFNLEIDMFAASPFRDVAEALQANFAQAGINVSLVASDRRQTLTKYRARNHQAVLMVWSPDYGDPHSTIDFFVSNPDNSDEGTVKTAAWRNAWFSQEMKDLADKAIVESDSDARKEMYTTIQRTLQTDSPFVVMFQQTEPVAMRSNVQHWVSGPAFDTYVFRGLTK